jgi:hypothetical protein
LIRRWKALLQLFSTPYHFQVLVDTALESAPDDTAFESAPEALSNAVLTLRLGATQW